MNSSLLLRSGALAGALALTLTACGTADAGSDAGSGGSGKTISVEDNNGKKDVPADAQNVVATDNRTFETLEAFGVELKAGAVTLMPTTIGYKKDKDIIDLGSHREPDLEQVVAVEPDLIINGQRYAQYEKDFEKLAPEATILNLDPREDKPFDEELKRQTTTLGTVFGKEDEAKKINGDFDDAVKRAKDAYDPKETVMGVITSGGELGYVVPGDGRTVGPVFDMLGMTPALEVEGSDDHQGDDISVEAIADSNPDWLLVMDRDAAVAADEPDYKPAADVIEKNPALKNVTAVKEGNIVYMPADTYTNESIQTYTEFLGDFADALEGKAKN